VTLPELAIKRPVTILMVLVSIIVLGLVALQRLPLAFMPDFVEPELFVHLPYENASPSSPVATAHSCRFAARDIVCRRANEH